jgi:hypothetical protein
VGGVIEVFDRIMLDDEAPVGASLQASGGQRVRHHYVLIDYLCRPTGGTLRAGSDVSEAVIADPRDLAQYAVTAKVEAVALPLLKAKNSFQPAASSFQRFVNAAARISFLTLSIVCNGVVGSSQTQDAAAMIAEVVRAGSVIVRGSSSIRAPRR